jgi:thioredoxin-dependent peroxiredoxin
MVLAGQALASVIMERRMAKKIAKKATKKTAKKVSQKVSKKVTKTAATKVAKKAAAPSKVAPAAKAPKAAPASAGLQVGDQLPSFELPTADGSMFSNASLAGAPAVVYVYPEAGSPSCTKQACAFTDLIKQFEVSKARIVAISPDASAKLAKFRDKYNLAVTLVGDVPAGDTPATIAALGCWGEKSMYGKSYMGVIRSTFVIDGTGRITAAWRNVKVPGHAEEVLAAVKAIG